MVSVCLPSDALLQHLPSYLGFSYHGRGISLHGCSSKAQLLLLTLDEGYLLITAPPDSECGIAPLGNPAPTQPPLLGHGVAPPGRCPDLGHVVVPLSCTTLMAESEEELKSLLMKVKVESEKVGLKLNIPKMKIMAFGPITSWEIDGETVETVSDFIFLDSKITADGDCSHEIKRHLLLGRKVMTNLDSILKSRDIANKCPSSQGYGFSSGHVWM